MNRYKVEWKSDSYNGTRSFCNLRQRDNWVKALQFTMLQTFKQDWLIKLFEYDEAKEEYNLTTTITKGER